MAPVTGAREGVELVEGAPAHDAPMIEEDLLVEEVSIDGMCGVY